MINNITIVDQNGNEIFAEGIACIQFLSSGKSYVLYTMNESAPNNRFKMYIGPITEAVGDAKKVPVSDAEWNPVRVSLEKIRCGEILPDVKYLNMGNTSFNISIPKKLAITAEDKQKFKDCQAMGVLADQQKASDGPAVTSSTGNFFNKEEVTEQPAYVSPDSANQETANIFNNPMKPSVVPMQSAGEVVEQNAAQGVNPQGGTQMTDGMTLEGQGAQIQNNQMMMGGEPAVNAQVSLSTPAPQPMPQTPMGMGVAPQPATPQPAVGAVQTGMQNGEAIVNNGMTYNESATVVDNPFIANSMPAPDTTATSLADELQSASLTDKGDSIQFQEGLATNVSNDLGAASGITPKSDDKEVTKEEALEALEVLNKYFKNTKELPSTLANELNSQKTEETELVTKEPQAMSMNTTFVPDTATVQNATAMSDAMPQASAPAVNDGQTFQDSLGSVPQMEPAPVMNNGSDMNNGMNQEQGRTLSLTPEGMPSVTPAPNAGMNAGDMGYQATDMSAEMSAMPQVQPQTGYVASSNGAAIDMTVTQNNIADVPVTLPDNYNPQMANNITAFPTAAPNENVMKVA